jgi:ethanolamine utilization protein EutQ (cupin superfamily)
LRLPPHQAGVPHRPSNEESIFILEGNLKVTIDGVTYDAAAGDVIHVSAGTQLCVDSQEGAARAWVTSTSGLKALMPDGTTLAPPWAE